MDSLSKRQQQIYNFIESYIEQKGFGPTVREICEAVNLSSPSTVHVHLKTLEDKGYKFDSAQIEMVPQTYQKLDKQEDRDNMEKMLDLFEEDDDVQNVWHNWEND